MSTWEGEHLLCSMKVAMDAHGHVWAPLCTRHTLMHVISMCKHIFTRHMSVYSHVRRSTFCVPGTHPWMHMCLCEHLCVPGTHLCMYMSVCQYICVPFTCLHAHTCMCVCMLAPLGTRHISMHAHVLLWTLPCTRHTSMHIGLPIWIPMCAKCLYMQQPPTLPLRVILLFFPLFRWAKRRG